MEMDGSKERCSQNKSVEEGKGNTQLPLITVLDVNPSGVGKKETGRKSMHSPVYHSKKQLLLKSGKSRLLERMLEPNKIPEIACL